MLHKAIIPILGVIVVGAAVACGVVAVVKRRKYSQHTDDVSAPNEKIIEAIKLMIVHLSGSMAALSEVMEEGETQSANVVFTNISHAISNHGSEALKSWFDTFAGDRQHWNSILYKQKATEMFRLLIHCGVKKYEETKFVWDDLSALRYRRMTKVEKGQRFKVMAPCWYYDGLIFEQGFVKAEN